MEVSNNKSDQDQLVLVGYQLLAVLEELLSLHQHLENVLIKEQELTASCVVEELENIQKRKMEIAGKISTAELTRQDIIKELAAALTLEFEDIPRFTELIPHFASSLQTKLTEIHKLLLAAVLNVQELTKQTSSVAKARLISLNSTTAQIDKWMAFHTFYSRQGSLKNESKTRFLSCHI